MPEMDDAGVAQEMLREKSTERLEEIAGRMRAAGVATVEPAVTAGDPCERILQQAETHDANLIFIGSGQKPHDDRFPLGIIAARICRLASRPVWVVKPGAPDRAARILCAVDFSDTSRRVLTNVVHLARAYEAELTVLTVVAPVSSWLGPADPEAQQVHLAEERARFQEFLEEFDFHGVSHQAVVRQGQPHEEILAAVADGRRRPAGDGLGGAHGPVAGPDGQRRREGHPADALLDRHAQVRARHPAPDRRPDRRPPRPLQAGAGAAGEGVRRRGRAGLPRCIAESAMYAPAWEGLAAAQERQGHKEQADESRRHAHEIIKTLWDRQIEAEIRSHHLLWRKRVTLADLPLLGCCTRAAPVSWGGPLSTRAAWIVGTLETCPTSGLPLADFAFLGVVDLPAPGVEGPDGHQHGHGVVVAGLDRGVAGVPRLRMHWSQLRKWSGVSTGSTGVSSLGSVALLAGAGARLTVGLVHGVRSIMPWSPQKRSSCRCRCRSWSSS